VETRNHFKNGATPKSLMSRINSKKNKMWKCKNCNEDVEDNFDVCWNCSFDKYGKPMSEKEQFVVNEDNIEDDSDISEDQINKVINVSLTGGLIGLFADSPQSSLNSRIRKENTIGWKVIQVIPADSGNVFLFIFRLLLLICTLSLYTTANGYYVILERTRQDKKTNKGNSHNDKTKCPNCGKEYSLSLKGTYCQECGKKI
jgi:hypothetical protein